MGASAGRVALAAHTGALPTAPSARAEFAADFDKVWRITRDHFYDRKMNGVDWAAIGDRYRPLAEAATSREELADVINRMLRELKASHIGYYTPDDFEFYFLPSVFGRERQEPPVEQIGVTGERTRGGYLVSAVLDGSPAAMAGVHVGDTLVQAGGQPFTTVGAFRGHTGNSMLLLLDRPGQGRLTVVVKPVRETIQQPFLQATERSIHVIDTGGKRLGYIHLWCMTSDRFRALFASALTDKLANTDGLILDLRDGFGGTPTGYTDPLFVPDVRIESEDRGRRTGGHVAYNKPVVAVINNGTRSAKEYLSYVLKKTGRATLVGTRTAGAFLGAIGFPIGADGFLELPVLNLSLDGTRLEGRGVSPDVEVAAHDTYQPDDAQLARARETLLTKLSPTGSTQSHRVL